MCSLVFKYLLGVKSFWINYRTFRVTYSDNFCTHLFNIFCCKCSSITITLNDNFCPLEIESNLLCALTYTISNTKTSSHISCKRTSSWNWFSSDNSWFSLSMHYTINVHYLGHFFSSRIHIRSWYIFTRPNDFRYGICISSCQSLFFSSRKPFWITDNSSLSPPKWNINNSTLPSHPH